MSANYARREGNRKSCYSFVFLLLISSISAIMMTPHSEASSNGDLAILDSEQPMPDSFIAAYDSIQFTVLVENNFNSPSPPSRLLNWYACEGVKPTNVCVTNSDDNGVINVGTILPGNMMTFTSNDYFNPQGYSGLMTIVYQFDSMDLNPGDDVLSFTVNSTLEYVDLKLDYDVDIMQSLNDLSTYDGNFILNSNKTYNFTMDGFANLCGSCDLNATVGWQLINSSSKEIINESLSNYSNFPSFGFYKSFSNNLPSFSHNETGTYILKYGIFNSQGDPNHDMFPGNNLNEITLLINNDIDLRLVSFYPSHNPSSTSYNYGNNMVTSEITLHGNKSVNNVSILLEVIDSNGIVKSSDSCLTGKLRPNEYIFCQFNLNSSGNNLKIIITIPNSVEEGIDLEPSNNIIEEITEIIIPPLSAYIVNNNPKEWYSTSDTISLTGHANIFAPGPVNYSWWYSGIVNLGYGENLNLNAQDVGLGEHTVRLTARDIFGNIENVFYSLDVYYYVEFDNSPYLHASSATIETSVIEVESMLPLVGESYGVGNGKSPLMLISFDLNGVSSQQNSFTGSNWMDIEFNPTEILPSNVPFDSVEIRKLDGLNDTIWDLFDSSQLTTNEIEENITLTIYEPTTVLIVGEMNLPNIEATNFTTSLAPEGKFKIDWQPVGELENEYLSGWNIYRLVVPSTGGTVFPSSNQIYSQLVWDSLSADSYLTTVTIETSSWNDLSNRDEGECVSYAIAPVDRQGVIHFERANVTTDENGDGTFVCGDNTPPNSQLIDLTHSWEFTNSSDCFKIENDWSLCYKVNLSWTWPEHESEGNVTWNLYRIEQNPDNIDISLISPILSNIEAVPQETANYTEYGWEDNGIRPERTYYYILAPIDWVGNEKSIIEYTNNEISQNVERVEIDDDWWAYYQHLIPLPPEPEDPPLNNEWLGNVSESLEQDEFKIAGVVMIITICLSFIMLPLIIKKRKRLKRVIDARNRQKMTDSMADEFDDFFD